jgi:hypothetical protein
MIPFDPTVQPQPAQPQPTDTPSQGQIQPQATPQYQVPPQNPNIAHDTLIGRAFKALTGNDTQYTIDPNTGQTVATQTPQRPGQLWRNIVAAAIVGGAAGANGNPQQGFAGGFVRGGAAEGQEQQKQDAVKRQQAQTQFQNQNAANAEQREAQAAVTIDTLRKAQIAGANLENLRTAQLTQGESFKLHSDVASAGKQHFSDYDAAGLSPIMKDIPETEMQQTIANRPGSSTFDWEATGVKVGVDPKTNQPTYEYLYSAYDPKGQIPVSAGTIAQWKSDGMDKSYPDLFNIVKPGKMLEAQQYVELKRLDTKLFNDNLERQKSQQGADEIAARIKASNAEVTERLANAARARVETGQLLQTKTQQQAFGKALDELNTVDGDFSKLTPKSKVIIGESAKTLIPGITDEIRSAVQDNDTDKAHQLMGELDDIRHLATQALGVATNPSTNSMVSVAMPDGTTGQVPSNRVADFLAAHPGATKAVTTTPKPHSILPPVDPALARATAIQSQM